MKRLIDYINNNVLIRVASLNSTSLLIRIISGVLTSKAIAFFIGPEGMALIGNLRNILSSFHSIAILGLYNGVVKYVSEFKNNAKELSKTISSAYYLGFIFTTIVAVFCYYTSGLLNRWIFGAYDYSYVFKLIALALPFYSLNMFCFSIINGFSKYKILLVINIIGQFLGLLITLFLIWQNNIDGAFVAVVISPSLIFLITLVAIINRKSLFSQIKVSNVNLRILRKLSVFSLMALITAIVLPLVTIVIRNYIIENVGMKEAGYWEGMNRISNYYLMFINSLLALYILPRFSEINNVKEFRKEVFNFYKTLMPVFGLGLLVIYLLRPFIVKIIFSIEFEPMEDLFLWYLLGDFVKVLSIVIAYQFLAKKMFWHYLITEVFLVLLIYLSSIYFIDIYGVKGATIAHFVTYLFYFGVILLIFGTSLFGVLEQQD
ncbi:MAG: O-antigen translocase [Bacteroidia bacterium]|nr:O-antigen translocase [Bacteroidia bacterium]